jgi:hypothetical protein
MIKDFARAMKGLCSESDDVLGAVGIAGIIAGMWIALFAVGCR